MVSKLEHPRSPLHREPCGVCGKVIVCKPHRDLRRGKEGMIRCHEHVGVEVDPNNVPPNLNVLDLPCGECGHEWRCHDRPDGCKDCERAQEEDEDVEVCHERHPMMPMGWWMWKCPVCATTARMRGYGIAKRGGGCSFCDTSHPETRGQVELRERGPTVIAYTRTRRNYGRHNMTFPFPERWP